ncbi:hypothetical protein ULMS_25690 [Patiriisocius marinistellae]|uniref:Secretion system C-terminal sorting domain-containing protein n=1 Tax=Patiriisocius marinistellae TaxID=2494560 RepID=A0A5J4G3T2_9FLAO|nr:T9SS type A sorting domain-containing protein [Patiriisocius marinistellae]GEQ87061.1 hypothetical protein ULMS_25690 [Patiriisocius marinistellae]
MSKKLHLLGTALLMSAGMFAQTIVGTAPENKNVILEEFTGIKCTFCPDGHARANAFKATDPDNIFLINIHAGSFAIPSAGQPDFRTPFGEAIASQSQLAGYPAGTINRHAFPGQQQNGSPAGATAQGRGTWATTGASWLNEPSYLNMGVEAEIDMATNIMTVHIEGYYTGDSPESTNKLNFAVVQNNTTGPQTGGGAGNNYNHNHRLIDMPLGQWGMEITTTTANSFVDETFTYTIPADNNGVAIDITELEFVAFMTETNQEIITGIGGVPTYTNVAIANDVSLLNVEEIDAPCDANDITPTIEIRNLGATTITSLDINYTINGGPQETYTYTGNLTSFQYETIEIDEAAYTISEDNTIVFTIANDDDNSNNELTAEFSAPALGTGNSTLSITADQYANEISFRIYNSTGDIVESGALTSANNNSTVTFNIALDTEDCFKLELRDSYGDGVPGGRALLEDLNGVILADLDGNFTSTNSRNFNADGVLGLGDNNISNITIYPNPANTQLNISNADNSTIEIYNILGQVMMTKSNISLNEALNVSQLVTGTYLVKISNGTTITTKKFIIAR